MHHGAHTIAFTRAQPRTVLRAIHVLESMHSMDRRVSPKRRAQTKFCLPLALFLHCRATERFRRVSPGYTENTAPMAGLSEAQPQQPYAQAAPAAEDGGHQNDEHHQHPQVSDPDCEPPSLPGIGPDILPIPDPDIHFIPDPRVDDALLCTMRPPCLAVQRLIDME